MMSSRNFLMLMLLLVGFYSADVYAQTHPVILGDESQYPALIDKANEQPWSKMKDTAADQAKTESYEYSLSYDENSYGDYCHRMRSIMTACAMSYILDPSNQSLYVNKATDQMLNGLNFLIDNRPSNTDWTSNVPFGMALFETIITLDVLYNDMNATDIEDIEDILEGAVSSLRDDAWELSYHAVQGTWALYNGDTTAFNIERAAYRNKLLSEFSPDGVFYAGTGYAFTRMAGLERNQKHLFMDILEIHGHDYYNNDTLRKGHEWMFGYGSTPFGRAFPFGDTSIGSYAAAWPINLASYRASQFGMASMKYANWYIRDADPRPSLVLLVAAKDNDDLNQKSIAPSKIFEDGGAWLRENQTDKNILSGALWNCKEERLHSHYETNAISLAAYGEILLGNAGYNEFYEGEGTWTWEDIRHRAVTANTVLIDYDPTYRVENNYTPINNHAQKSGAGIREGLTTGVLDYACGDSGGALPNGSHERNFMFVHPDNSTPGYWILMDKISGNADAAQGHIALHPYSNKVTTASTDKEYRWAVKLYGEDTTYLSIHLANKPNQLQLLDGTAADGKGGIPHKFLYNTYDLDDNGEKEVITLLFPHQEEDESPVTTNLDTNPDYTGSVVNLENNIKDHVIESTKPSESINYDNDYSLTGNMSVFRTNNGNVEWYFVKSGTEFSSQNAGFTASTPISIFMNGNTGQATTTTSTTVSITSSTCASGVQLNGQTVGLTFTLPAGTNDIQIIQNGTDSDGDGVCDAQDICPGFDDNLIGTTCDDGNPNTTNDVYTTNCICEGTPTQTNGCELITNGDFNNDTTNWGTWECDLNISNGEAVITNITTGANPWNAGFSQQGITLEQGKTYTLTFRAKADVERGIYYKVGLPASSYFYKNAILTTNMQDYEHTFIMDEPTNTNVHVEFFFAHYKETVYIDDVSLVENGCSNCPSAGTSCNDNNPATYNDVEDGFCNCAGTPCPSAGTSCDDNNAATYNDVEDGFCNCAGTPCSSAGTSCNDNNAATYNDVEDGFCNCTGTPCPSAGTSCDDGNPNTINDIEDGFCNCNGTPVQNDCELIINGDFDNDTSNWATWECNLNVSGGEAIISDIATDADPWTAGLFQNGITLEQGKTYTLTFRAKADTERGIYYKVGLPATSYFYKNAIITTSMQDYEHTFTVSEPTNTNVHVEFFFAHYKYTVYIDDVSLVEDGCANKLANDTTTPSMRIYPNPVNDILNIGIQNVSGEGMVKIYDLTGKPIGQQIINEASTDLRIEVGHLPAGTYMIRFELGKDIYAIERFVKLSE